MPSGQKGRWEHLQMPPVLLLQSSFRHKHQRSLCWKKTYSGRNETYSSRGEKGNADMNIKNSHNFGREAAEDSGA